MKVKLDENLGQRGGAMFAEAGHDVATVADEGLTSASDAELIEACKHEERCLVTLDMDFSNPFVFSPEEYSGIAVIRLPRRSTPEDLHARIENLIRGLAGKAVAGKLWIVERVRIREYMGEEND